MRNVVLALAGWAIGNLALAGCAKDPVTSAPIVVERPPSPCTDLTRLVARWQGQEMAACGDEPLAYRSLLPLGDGLLLAWTTVTGRSELWSVGRDGTLGPGPLDSHTWSSIRHNKLLVPLRPDRMIDFDPRNGGLSVWKVDLTARGTQDPLTPKVFDGHLPETPGGRDLAALDERRILDWQPGTGAYTVIDYERSQEPGTPLRRYETMGTREAFRRGHRLVALGADRLLEWVPVTQEFRVWRYAVDRLPADIFDAQPVASGTWPSLRSNHEILVLAPDQVAIWDRSDGSLEVRRLDPTGDPLANPPLNRSREGHLRSLMPGLEVETSSAIRRLVILFQEGRAFDTYFGHYCQAAPGSDPACDEGPGCCEAMPATTPGAGQCFPFELDDGHVPNATAACLLDKIHDGEMDRFVESSLPGCGDRRDFACAGAGADAGPVGAYHALAAEGTLADRYFASAAGPALTNLIFFGKTGFIGPSDLSDDTLAIATLLNRAHIGWSVYLPNPAERYGLRVPDFHDGRWAHFRYVDELIYDAAMEQLPQLSLVLAGPDRNEAPNTVGSLAKGTAFVADAAHAILRSPRHAADTVVIVAHLTSGGFFDHVRPPSRLSLEIEPVSVPYGPRVPFIALGRFVRPNHVSHTPLEHGSLTTFIEWNWLGGRTGQLGGRDRVVNNLGSLFDPRSTGVSVPERNDSPR